MTDSYQRRAGWQQWGRVSWTVLVSAIALLLTTPILVVLSSLTDIRGEVWQHLADTVLLTYVTNSLGLMVGVGLGTVVVGTATAWLVTMCRFPLARLLAWGLLLPLAAPAYILAYVYTEWLAFYGPVQGGVRSLFGWQNYGDYWFPEVRSLGGAILMLTLVLYPYVYLLARTAFLSQATCTLEASRVLGCGPWRSFWLVAIPMARPGIMAGLALVLMETLNDFGTVEFFSVPTFTTGIYRTWFGMGERAAAAQLSACLLLFIVGLVMLERWSRGQARYYQTGYHPPPQRYDLRGGRAFGALLVCLTPLALGFLLPASLLFQMVWAAPQKNFDAQFVNYLSHSLLLAGLTAAIALLIGIIMAYGRRLYPNTWMRSATQIAAMGYAVPGSVIAVGILVPLGLLDNTIDAWMRANFGISTGLLLSGTIAALVFAYLVRFLAVAFGAIDASLVKIKPSLDDAARSLGQGTLGTLWRVHLPLLSQGLLTATTLVFVDVMKELPATLIVRPFNFDTLAVRVYNLASDERLSEAAGTALAIVAAGMLPVLLLSWGARDRGPEQH